MKPGRLRVSQGAHRCLHLRERAGLCRGNGLRRLGGWREKEDRVLDISEEGTDW